MTLWLKYKHNMTTNKQNQHRTGKLSTHNIFHQVVVAVTQFIRKQTIVCRAKVELGSSKLNYSSVLTDGELHRAAKR